MPRARNERESVKAGMKAGTTGAPVSPASAAAIVR